MKTGMIIRVGTENVDLVDLTEEELDEWLNSMEHEAWRRLIKRLLVQIWGVKTR